jgi:hypothetical protein
MEKNLQMNGRECSLGQKLSRLAKMTSKKVFIILTISTLREWLSHIFIRMIIKGTIIVIASLCVSACSTTQISSDIPSGGLNDQKRASTSTYNTNNNLLDSPDGSTRQGNLRIFGATY